MHSYRTNAFLQSPVEKTLGVHDWLGKNYEWRVFVLHFQTWYSVLNETVDVDVLFQLLLINDDQEVNGETNYFWRCRLDLVGSLSSDVFERRTSTGSEIFSLLTCLDDIKFVLLSFFTVIEAIWLKICAKPPSKNEKRPLPVDVRRSETLLLKLPTISIWRYNQDKCTPQTFP